MATLLSTTPASNTVPRPSKALDDGSISTCPRISPLGCASEWMLMYINPVLRNVTCWSVSTREPRIGELGLCELCQRNSVSDSAAPCKNLRCLPSRHIRVEQKQHCCIGVAVRWAMHMYYRWTLDVMFNVPRNLPMQSNARRKYHLHADKRIDSTAPYSARHRIELEERIAAGAAHH
jgi:hypothetical protein